MKTLTLALGLVFAPMALAADNETPPEAPVYFGSCVFEGQYASGCIEFFNGAWTAETTQAYCQTQSKTGTTPVMSATYCAKADFNTLCAATQTDGSLANFYVSNLPSFICKKYMGGVLTKRPTEGWPADPEPTQPTPEPSPSFD